MAPSMQGVHVFAGLMDMARFHRHPGFPCVETHQSRCGGRGADGPPSAVGVYLGLDRSRGARCERSPHSPTMMLARTSLPLRPRSSPTAIAPGVTWMDGCPPPRRLPSSISNDTPAVAFTMVAQTGCTRWP